jgi:sialate O-acetylesterase
MKKFCFLALLFLPASRLFPIELPDLFSDHMVLQRGRPVPVWGTASPGERITVTLAGVARSAITSAEGTWRVDLPAMAAGGPFELVVAGKETIVCKDLLVGEVWLCSGQSNMALSVRESARADSEIAAARYPAIRLFEVNHVVSPVPLSCRCGTGWTPCDPAHIAGFSAAAYFFGRELYNAMQVPIGLINASYGGTLIEAWTSADALRDVSSTSSIIAEMEKYAAGDTAYLAQYRKKTESWKIDLNGKDPAFETPGLTWKDPEYDDTAWDTLPVPQLWEGRLANYDGALWYRTRVSLPVSWAGQELTLTLGPADDIDVTWFNGVFIGSGEQWDMPRTYTVPSGLAKAGENLLAIRVLDNNGPGGLWGSSESYALKNSRGESIPLAGRWPVKLGLPKGSIPPSPVSFQDRNCPTVLFNGMITPLIPYALAGIIWYQGESNTWNAAQYQTLFPLMIGDWRRHWGEGELPFLYVQLANYFQHATEPGESDWAELRDAQRRTLAVGNTGMAVAIDIGDSLDIHPRNKQEVGRRLGLIARSRVYGERIEFSGPLYESMMVKKNQIYLTFRHAEGLCSKGRPLQGFTVAGTDRKFYPARARIDGKRVVVSSTHVPQPAAVRYGWAMNPVCTLYNGADLPASPFRTDDWPGTTWGF